MLNALTMIPIFVVAAYMKYEVISVAILNIGISGILYHSYKDRYPQLLWLDLIAILFGLTAYTYYSKIDDLVKNYLLILEGLVVSIFILSMILNIKPLNQILLSIMAIIWVPNLFYSMKYFANFTIFMASIVVLLYLYSECICNTHKYKYLLWPSLHVSIFYFLYLSFKDMDMLIQ
jgi:hypothetical protein